MKKLRYGDIIIFIFIIVFSFFYAKKLITNKSNKIIIDTYEKSFRYDLNTDREIKVNGLLGETTIIISNNQIMFADSPCRDKLCVKAGVLKNAPLICMPNGVIIHFEKNSENNLEIDSIVQ
ncbi:NusG domain II-containing protein [uncultured Brachyspira sp.]|uniref:NusG domain II-containing protein n=1 Tax=uncultured Brachyspira sp. TaxID=221953 RepID=UPI002601D284|nr:NusG domain II-containing protein [uncultured Brachyspira sp.]